MEQTKRHDDIRRYCKTKYEVRTQNLIMVGNAATILEMIMCITVALLRINCFVQTITSSCNSSGTFYAQVSSFHQFTLVFSVLSSSIKMIFRSCLHSLCSIQRSQQRCFTMKMNTMNTQQNEEILCIIVIIRESFAPQMVMHNVFNYFN